MPRLKRHSVPDHLQRYPYFIGILLISIISVIAQIMLILDCIFPLMVHTTDAVSSVMSTCSEVIAGLYGITLTGYIFFADRFQDTSNEDESLYDAVQALLLRYNHMAGIISVLCLICIVSAEAIVLYGTNTLLPQGIYRFWVNETLLLFFWNFNFILYFVISVLDPHKVSRISSQKKARLSIDKNAGDSTAFMADWKAIEEALYILRENLIRSVRFVPGASRNKPEMIRVLDTLRNYGKISNGMWQKLNKLRQYYYLTLHDPNATVSAEMCTLAKDVLAELNAKYMKTKKDE